MTQKLRSPMATSRESAQAAGTALIAGGLTCRRTVKAYLECGRVNLYCTLPPEHDDEHYDDVFMQTWRDIAPQAD